ncbi:MAG TPA: hypothetical protein VD768_08730 [Sphingomicrobium sp.]|nr:hypothetical protein [Sphingomicrobium sp.]
MGEEDRVSAVARNTATAWALLVREFVELLRSLPLQEHIVTDFLARLEEANEQALRGHGAEAYMEAIARLRAHFSDND